ncbi:MAG: RdgB/HAM1 family non-canonical purine NTP pyrophosphatase [bacterium]|nr:RdgB/HAM1 family non-canonical purine NTP pyrophosphatase [bacterium]
MSSPLLIATGNRHKADEIGQLLAHLNYDIKCLSDMPPVDEAVEDGDTFEDNALKKARHYYQAFDVPCLADDSGLVVDALDGDPGVWSSRYAGEDASDADNNAKLLDALREVPESDRTARFACCAVLVEPGGKTHVESGAVEGRIAFECRGSHGFGYDPLFHPDGHEGSFGELGPSIKQAISHRAVAFGKLLTWLESRS